MIRNLTRTQRDRILMITAGVAVVIFALWMGLVQGLNGTLEARQKKIVAAQGNLDRATGLIRRSSQIQDELEMKRTRLREIEDDMASGDLYSWVILTLNKFKAAYRVSIPNYSPAQMGEVGLLPDFPYSAATFAISGTTLYHDFGRFVADFENSHPYMRVQNLELHPATGPGADEPEKLEFKMEVVALVKSAGTK